MKSFLDFVKYNNAFPIILSVVILGTGAVFAASPELRQTVFPSAGKTSAPTAPKKTDASKLLSEDISDFDLRLRIDTVTEDTGNYHVAYSYTTFEVVDGAWKEVRKNAKMDIPKALLGKRDLKSYLVEQIGQVIDREVAYLSEAKAAVKTKPSVEKSKEYASLSGTEIDAEARKAAEKSGSSPSVTDEPKPSTVNEETKAATTPGVTLTKEEVNEMIVKAVSDFLAIDTSMPEPLPETLPTEEPTEKTPSSGENTSETGIPATEEAVPTPTAEP